MDILRKPFTDLSNPRTQTSFLERVRDGSYFAVILSPPCSTFSRAPWRNRRGPRPIRSHDYPDGLPGLRWAERRKARLGNTLADFSLRTATAALDLPCAFALLEQPEDLGAVAIGRRPSSMWQRPLFQAVVGHPNAQHVVFHQADFGTPYPKPTRLLLRTRQALPAGMRSGLPNFDSQGFYTGPLPRHPTARPMQTSPKAGFSTSGTEKWPSAFCEWVARCIFSDFSATAGVGDLKAAPSSETETTDEEVGEERIFRFDPVVPTGTTDGLGDIEMRALNHLRRGYIAEEDLVLLSQQLPDETRIRESTARVAGQRSFTTGAYIHREEIGLRRNLRDFKWTSELLARLVASSFPGKPFTSLALFRDLKQPPHRDSTNGPEENLLLACTSFQGGGLWVQKDGGSVRRQIFGRDMEGEILEWKKGRITFDAHCWHSTEDWTGLRLVLAGYTVARAESLSGRDKDVLRERGFILGSDGSRRQEPDLDPTWPPTPGGRGPARVCQEPWGNRPFHDGAGLCSPGRWDPEFRTYCSSDGWDKLRGKLEEILVEHAGGPEKLDRTPFEMAAKGEEGCRLVADPALHEKLRAAMIAHLERKSSGSKDLDVVDPGQPFRLRLISALLRDASDPDWRVFLEGIEGFPVGVKNPLPRTRDVFEPQTKWKLEMGPLDVAKSWKANYESAEENLSFVREHFDTEVAEGLMTVMDEKDFWARYGREAAISAIAVIVEEGPPVKRRVVHDASHDVLLNHRIRCLDKVRAPGAREKRLILRKLRDEKMAPVAVTGDISKAHRRFKHRTDEWGFLGCKASSGDDVVYINCVGTFGVASAGYWWARLSGGTIRLTHHLTGKRALEILLFADDVEMIGGDRQGRRGIVLAYAILASLGLPFKWSKTKGGLNVQWIGYETSYATFRLGISERRASWLADWTEELAKTGIVTWDDFACGLGRLGFGANALSWERPFLGPLYAWSSATRGRKGGLRLPVMLRSILGWMSLRFRSGDRLQAPMPLAPAWREASLSFFSDAKAEETQAWIGGYLWDGQSALQWYAMEVREDWAPWAFIKKDLKRTIASLELLGTLICVKLWGAKMSESGRGSGYLTGGTDNQGNSYAVSKLMSTKFPLPLLLMELSETLRKGEQCLDLSWVPREKNQWADDLTNQKFDRFCLSKRLILDGTQIDWIILDSLLKSAAEFHAELVMAKRKEPASGYQKSKKKRRTKW